MTAYLRDASAADLSPDWVIEPLAPEVVQATRLQVALHAADVEEAGELLDMLGIREAPAELVTTRSGLVHLAACAALRPVHERWPWQARNDGPDVARACSKCLPKGLPA